ncbi:2'-5' RNA ligase [Jatrophihabitans sp. GAS493]|uniref:2'-5' RNA ligase family protein n=1 Tax=Jatrophihabitans sp. GAS493 TaxID=1907575 RepID=UPI000BB939FF|nr:2'-5' RNA ligase family protein [Jatrophihabitans sp. GAS493]SOD71955.1 2'-5' RNA ligase [Jatrophihabitans sp. GAS493]
MSATLGVVIDIPEPHSTVLTGWRRSVGDPQADMIWPHVTLLPPTAIAKVDLDEIESHLAKAAEACGPFPMHLAGTGTFRPLSPVVFIQVARGLAECELLEKAIRSGPLARDLEFPYHPHVTVAHDVDEDALDTAYSGLSDYIARFVVDRFTLFERGPGGGWTQRRHYQLGTAGPESGTN